MSSSVTTPRWTFTTEHWYARHTKKEPQRVIHTMAHQSKISYFSSDTGSFHSKGQNRQIASFFCTQKPFFEKARKTEIKREKRRKTCVFRCASFLYTLRGGGEGNRTPVRKPLDATFSGCRKSTELPESTADSQAVISVAF